MHYENYVDLIRENLNTVGKKREALFESTEVFDFRSKRRTNSTGIDAW
jgi:nitric oxide reductase activation protein